MNDKYYFAKKDDGIYISDKDSGAVLLEVCFGVRAMDGEILSSALFHLGIEKDRMVAFRIAERLADSGWCNPMSDREYAAIRQEVIDNPLKMKSMKVNDAKTLDTYRLED